MFVKARQLYESQNYSQVIELLNPTRSSESNIPKSLLYIYLWSLYRSYIGKDSPSTTSIENKVFAVSEIRRLAPDGSSFLTALNVALSVTNHSYLNDDVDYEEMYYGYEDLVERFDYDDLTAIEQGNL